MTGPVFRGRPCEVVAYTPLISGMCDAVILIDGAELAVGSHEIRTGATGAPWLEPRAAAVARSVRPCTVSEAVAAALFELNVSEPT